MTAKTPAPRYRLAGLALLAGLTLGIGQAAVADVTAEAVRAPTETRAKTYNSSRSNKTDGVSIKLDAGDCDDSDCPITPEAAGTADGKPVAAPGARGQDYNSSRSNKAPSRPSETGTN